MKKNDVEQSLISEVKRRGGICLKWALPDIDGTPYRLVFLPEGHFGLIEIKTPGKILRHLQTSRRRQLNGLGFKTYMLYKAEQIGGILNEIQSA